MVVFNNRFIACLRVRDGGFFINRFIAWLRLRDGGLQPFKGEAQTVLFKDTVRTAQ